MVEFKNSTIIFVILQIKVNYITLFDIKCGEK